MKYTERTQMPDSDKMRIDEEKGLLDIDWLV